MSMFTLAISWLTTSNLPWYMDLIFQVPMQILFFTALDLASITSHIHNWILFLLWLHPFILSGVISPLISSSILGTYWPGEFLSQYPIILPFHTVHGVLKARILKWFAASRTRWQSMAQSWPCPCNWAQSHSCSWWAALRALRDNPLDPSVDSLMEDISSSGSGKLRNASDTQH